MAVRSSTAAAVDENRCRARSLSLNHHVSTSEFAPIRGNAYSPLAFSGVWNSSHSVEGVSSFPLSVTLKRQKPSAVSYSTSIAVENSRFKRPCATCTLPINDNVRHRGCCSGIQEQKIQEGQAYVLSHVMQLDAEVPQLGTRMTLTSQ